MKKLIASSLIILSSLVITGCKPNCEKLKEIDCKAADICVSKYKPCNASEEGCADNRLFTECVTKAVKN
jgi:hypothetical protein